MHAAELVNRDITSAARTTAERTSSPYFGQALLNSRLRRLHDRIEELASRRPDEFAALAEHLGVPPTVSPVLADVDQVAQRLLSAFQAPDHHHRGSCSP